MRQQAQSWHLQLGPLQSLVSESNANLIDGIGAVKAIDHVHTSGRSTVLPAEMTTLEIFQKR